MKYSIEINFKDGTSKKCEGYYRLERSPSRVLSLSLYDREDADLRFPLRTEVWNCDEWVSYSCAPVDMPTL